MNYEYDQQKQELKAATHSGEIRICVLTDTLIRVKEQASDKICPGSLAVEAVPQEKCCPTINLEEERLTLSTAKLKIIVSIEGGIDFYDTSGTLLSGCFHGEKAARAELSDEEIELLEQEGHTHSKAGSGSVEFTRTLDKEDSIYGLGDKTGPLNKRGYEYEMWNTDDPQPHEDNFKALYKSIPMMIVLKEKAVYGFYFDSHEKATFNLGKESDEYWTCSFAGGSPDYYFIGGETIGDIVENYTLLTGRAPLPQLWTLGYHQSRWSYRTEKEVRALADTFRSMSLPLDCIHLDIDYMEAYKVFTWNQENFQDYKKMIRDLKDQGIRVVTIIDPGVKVEKDYHIYEEGMKNDYFAKTPEGEVYVNQVWPGDSVFPDFGQKKVRAWWAENQQFLLDAGVEGVWNDMNEPASFRGPLPDDILFFNEEIPSCHKSMHNTYGHNMAKATYQGLKERTGKRPFVITRACFSGTQKYAIVWTGDNHSLWTHLRMSIPQLCNLGLSGYPLAGCDIGGFGSDVTPELLVRWYQTGCFSTLFRNHSAMGTRRQEPWRFGDKNTDIIRKYVNLRYELLPYIYDLTYQMSLTGAPVMRPLIYHYSHDSRTHNLNDQFMLGPQLLISPVVEQGAVKKMTYLPEGDWYDYWTKEKISGGQFIISDAPLETCPIYVKAGTILPKYPVRQSIGPNKDDQLILEIYPGHGAWQHYQDNGQDFSFQNGQYNLYQLTNTPGKDLQIQHLHHNYKDYTQITSLII